METAVRRIMVLRLAIRTHAKAGHGGGRPVVRNILNDGVTRAAIGAVGERITEAAIFGIINIAQAIVAGGDIGARLKQTRRLSPGSLLFRKSYRPADLIQQWILLQSSQAAADGRAIE